jgi:hypothetical protein
MPPCFFGVYAVCAVCFPCVPCFRKVPVLGHVCESCLIRLGKPTLYEGCVTGESLLHIAERTDAEIQSRIRRLQVAASESCR